MGDTEREAVREEGRLAEQLTSGLLLAVLGEHSRQVLRAAYVADGLSLRQVRVLGLLHDNGATGQRDLGAHLNVDPSVLVTVLNPLEERGLITRDRDPVNRRRHLVTLTRAGHDVLANARRAQVLAEAGLFDGLDEADRGQLSEILDRLYDRFRQTISCTAS
jgi:DNA-binding MarR family transcriptional regulator